MNANGLQLDFSTNTTKIEPGQTISFNITEFNRLVSSNSLRGEFNFAYPWLTYNVPCEFAFGAMVLDGYYTMANVSSAVLLQSWQPGAGTSCPMSLMSWLDNSSIFQFAPRSSSSSLASTVSFYGYWNETNAQVQSYRIVKESPAL